MSSKITMPLYDLRIRHFRDMEVDPDCRQIVIQEDGKSRIFEKTQMIGFRDNKAMRIPCFKEVRVSSYD